MRLFITGASGFIGRNLIHALKQNGVEITACIRENSNISSEEFQGVSLFTDTGDTNLLIEHFSNHEYDGVVHLATCYIAQHCPADIPNLINSNITFSTRVLEAAAKAEIKWFINTGTFWQNFNNKTYSPANLYAATKQAFDTIAQYYIETSNICFSTIKLNDTFGPNDTRPKIFNLWKKIADSGETLPMSPGEQLIDILYIDDVINGFLRLIELLAQNNSSCNDFNGKSFCLKAQKRFSLKELASIFEEATDKKLNIEWGAREYRPREIMVPYENGADLPGWQPQKSIRKGIKELFK